MCGFAGIYSVNKIDLKKKIIKKMTKSMKRRGPDEKGYYYSDNLLLGHDRLSIIDPDNGTQPMIYNNYVIVYNGEIYNANEIREKLINRGYSFDTSCDTEVLLKGYIEYKEKILDMIEGIYSFCIYDGKKIFLARDRLGVKPLFYSNIDGKFIFASEIKAILKSNFVKPIVDVNSLRELLALGPSRLPGSGVFKDIKELRPAHYLIYDNGKLEIKRYWNIKNKKCKDSFSESVKKVRELLESSIERQLVSDVGISTFLSGGLDSSIITAVTSKKLSKYGKTLDTYSIDYEDNDKYFKGNNFQISRDNEYIELMKNMYDTNHNYMILSQKKLAKSLKEGVKARDYPGMADIDSSLYLFSKKISKEQKVILSGECADEIFGGYPWFYNEEVRNRKNFPWISSLNERINILNRDIAKKLDLNTFINEEYQKSIEEVPKVRNKEEQKYKNLFYINMIWFMTTLLDRKDRMTMYASLEARIPFADTKLVEYLWNLPWDYKFKDNKEKALLREAFKDILPEEVYSRKKNPYPKTHNPKYTTYVTKLLKKSLRNKKSVLYKIFDKDKIIELINTKGSSFKEPWFGQLMTGPQLLAYLYQFDYWAKKYKIILKID